MIIKLNGKFWDISWEEVYHETHLYYLDTFGCGYTKLDVDEFWKNVKYKKVGKGSQTVIQIDTLADKRLLEKILYDITHYAKLNILDGQDVAFHKKALVKVDELQKQLDDWEKSFTVYA